ncbi:MAG: rRNA maturation RNase YbeY [Omnitrophica bacterium RIFCSPHIGHO2_02_FULL_46_11]|nr:MAG: rRNA maturation RNase YbeY [Omnitrophica bacterium RIFCSPHIGHO2_02_FULL_46_11]OGW87686.1 MAG: rRNA maturation RNase YbeY [Omnitrophica bacterium RIFCSPLOWO2_01_FULL_45_10b]
MGNLRTSGNRIFIGNVSSGFNIHLKQTRRLIGGILRKLKLRKIWISFVFVSDSAIKRLNRRYLKHSWATDVIAFPFSSGHSRQRKRNSVFFLGEIIISPKRAKLYAKKLGVPFSEELARYICHGILHLLGHSDKTAQGKKKMRRTEDQLIKPLAAQVKGIV